MTYTEENANITISQLGGYGKLQAMVGANNFSYDSTRHYVGFKFKMCKKMNYVKIKLNSMDTYDIEFGKLNINGYTAVEEINDVYCDQLVEFFEKNTGLYLSF